MTGALRQRLLEAVAATGDSMDDLSVLAGANDPYRADVPAMHVASRWLVDQMDRLRLRRPVHLRGLHYVLVAAGDVIRPTGKAYLNDEPNWNWLNGVSKAARYLGYVAWSDIADERNAKPELYFSSPPVPPTAEVRFDLDIYLPDYCEPTIDVTKFEARQPYQICLVGEKSSLADVLLPIARRFRASLALPTGEMSATMVAALACHMVADGRPAVVFYFSDSDPSGRQMPVSVARKLQAFRDLEYPTLDVRVYQAALTTEQVAKYGLPSTPLKESERRADRWKAAFGVEQTEIDALAALQPDLLRKIAEDAIAPFFDRTLESRCYAARAEYQEKAEEAFHRYIGDDAHAEQLRWRAELLLDEVRERVKDLREEMASTALGWGDLGLPSPVVPEPVLSGAEPTADLVYSTAWDWTEATARLKARKAYSDAAE